MSELTAVVPELEKGIHTAAALGELYLSVLELLFPVVGVKIDIQYSSPDLHGAKLYLYLSTGLIVLRHSVQCLVMWLEHHCALSGTVVDE